MGVPPAGLVTEPLVRPIFVTVSSAKGRVVSFQCPGGNKAFSLSPSWGPDPAMHPTSPSFVKFSRQQSSPDSQARVDRVASDQHSALLGGVWDTWATAPYVTGCQSLNFVFIEPLLC